MAIKKVSRAEYSGDRGKEKLKVLGLVDPGIDHQKNKEKNNEQRSYLFAAKVRFHGV